MAENVDPSPLGVSHSSVSTDVLPVLTSTCSQNDPSKADIQAFPVSPIPNRFSPLYGKNIFMHYDPGTTSDNQIERTLEKLKAKIVDFFSRDVHYVITNRPSSRIPLSDSKNQSVTNVQKDTIDRSPVGLPPPLLTSAKLPVSSVTRGRAMLMAARKATSAASQIHTNPPALSPLSVLRQLQVTESSPPLCSPMTPASTSGKPSSPTALTETASPNDLLVRARRLGIRILTTDAVLKWIRNLPSDIQSYINSTELSDNDSAVADVPEDPERDRLYQVRHLIAPCLKVIDLSGSSRPLYSDRTDYLPNLWNWPSRVSQKPTTATVTDLHIQVTSGTCGILPASPGLPTVAHSRSHPITPLTGTFAHSILSRHSRKKRKDHVACSQRRPAKGSHPLQRSTSISGKVNCAAERPKVAVEEEPSGYCECCSIAFANLMEHLRCDEHQQFANNNENYRLLDDVLSKLPTIEEFLSMEARKSRPSSVAQGNDPRKRLQRSRSKRPQDEPQLEQQAKKQKSDDADLVTECSNQTVEAGMLGPSELVAIHPPPCLNLPESRQEEVKQGLADHVHLFSDDDVDIDNRTMNVNLLPLSPTVGILSPPPKPASPCSASVNTVAVAVVSAVPFAECDPYYLPPVRNSMQFSPRPLVCQSDGVSTQFSTTVNSRVLLDHFNHPHASISHSHLTEAWHVVCDQVFIADGFKPTGPTDSQDTTKSDSPVLARHHALCTVCHRMHIPTSVSLTTHLQLSSLIGPSQSLDGFGCSGQQPVAEDASVYDLPSSSLSSNESVALGTMVFASFEPVAITQSPVFDRDESGSLPTLPMRRCSEPLGSAHLSASSVHSKLSSPGDVCNVKATSTPQDAHEDSPDQIRLSDMDDEDNFFCRSPSVRSDCLHGRRSSGWLFNIASFDAELPPSGDKMTPPALSAVTSGSPVSCIHCCNSVNSQAAAVKLSSQRTRQEANLYQVPATKRSKCRPVNLTPNTATASGLHFKADSRQEKVRKRAPKPRDHSSPSTQTSGRIPRVAAKVARESISLSIRALFSPLAVDRMPHRVDVRCPSPPDPNAIHSSCESSSNACRSVAYPISRPDQSRVRRKRLKRSTLFPSTPSSNS